MKTLHCRVCGTSQEDNDSVQLRLCGCVLCEDHMPCDECEEEDDGK